MSPKMCPINQKLATVISEFGYKSYFKCFLSKWGRLGAKSALTCQLQQTKEVLSTIEHKHCQCTTSEAIMDNSYDERLLKEVLPLK